MLKKPKCVLSYSGGKDSTLALYHMLQTAEPVALIAMLEEQGQRSRSHGMDTALIAAQAQALGLPIITAAASWQDYEAKFAEVLKSCQQQGKALPCWQRAIWMCLRWAVGMSKWRMRRG